MEWFRSWHGAPTDPKWLAIARKANVPAGMVSAVVWALFDHASQDPDRGSVSAFDMETYAAYSGWDEDDIARIMAALRAKGVIDADNRLAAWEKRQPQREDDSTPRVRDYRKRKGDAPEPELPLDETSDASPRDDVTQCNAVKRAETQCNAPEKNREDEIRTEIRESGAALSPAPPPPKPRASKPRDPFLDNFAVALYRDRCKLTANAEQRKAIAETVTDAAKWEEVMRQWQLAGFRPGNVPGMLDWYRKGIPKRSTGNGTSRPRVDPAVIAARRKVEAEYDNEAALARLGI